MLYKFDKLNNKMDDWGYPKVDLSDAYRVVREDFRKAWEDNKIVFEGDGIYYLDGDHKRKGYMYMDTYKVEELHTFPKFHLVECQVIRNFINGGLLNTYYRFSNAVSNDIIERTNDKIVYPDKVLQLCSFCQKMITDDIDTTENFFDTLNPDDMKNTDEEMDIFGYSRNWNKLSKDYRKHVQFTCEECGIQIANRLDQRFLHTHHVNGNKLDNSKSNLQCLCICCHARVDANHESNFSVARMKRELKAFIDKYGDQLSSDCKDLLNDDL